MEMKSVVCFIVVFFALSAVSWASVWYVKTDGVDPGDCGGGTSWATAFATIQKAIDCASNGDEIWVKAGTYLLSATIGVDKAVSLYGGFSGSETQRTQRNWKTNVTIVEGQDSVAHCFHVTADALIDGFTVTGGRASGDTIGNGSGGGLYIYECEANVANCRIVSNYAKLYGGGLYMDSSTGSVDNCVISENQVDLYRGGAIYCYFGSPNIRYCMFTANVATNQHGGAISGYGSSPTIASCIFLENTANHSGGAIECNHMTATITNCTFAGNTAFYGGAIRVYYSTGVLVTNSILWGDTANTGPEIDVTGDSGQEPTVTYCDVEGGYLGAGNINEDPGFVNVSSTEPAQWDVHLRPDSPCVDTGTNAASGIPAQDFEGNPRIIDGNNNGTEIVDMGGDEYMLAYAILHKDGAIWYSDSGWDLEQPPYYKDSDYARDIEFNGYVVYVLHKDGAIWNSSLGWILTSPPYYAGSGYAQAFEVKADGSYLVLHRDGAIYDSVLGWIMTTPPYYPGSGYATDLELKEWFR